MNNSERLQRIKEIIEGVDYRGSFGAVVTKTHLEITFEEIQEIYAIAQHAEPEGVFDAGIEYPPIFNDLLLVMERADGKWGGPKHDDKHTPYDWCEWVIAYATWARMMIRMDSPEKYSKRMLQAAQLAVHAVMSHRRKLKAGELNPTQYEQGMIGE